MSAAEFENFKVNRNVPVLTLDQKKEVMGRLKALDELSLYVDIIRESYTRELVVNGINSEEDLIKESKKELTSSTELSSGNESEET
jgi:hypothetical protein